MTITLPAFVNGQFWKLVEMDDRDLVYETFIAPAPKPTYGPVLPTGEASIRRVTFNREAYMVQGDRVDRLVLYSPTLCVTRNGNLVPVDSPEAQVEREDNAAAKAYFGMVRSDNAPTGDSGRPMPVVFGKSQASGSSYARMEPQSAEKEPELTDQQKAALRKAVVARNGVSHVSVFLFSTQGWTNMRPVDAKAFILKGLAALEITKMVNPATGKPEWVDAWRRGMLVIAGWKETDGASVAAVPEGGSVKVMQYAAKSPSKAEPAKKPPQVKAAPPAKVPPVPKGRRIDLAI